MELFIMKSTIRLHKSSDVCLYSLESHFFKERFEHQDFSFSVSCARSVASNEYVNSPQNYIHRFRYITSNERFVIIINVSFFV